MSEEISTIAQRTTHNAPNLCLNSPDKPSVKTKVKNLLKSIKFIRRFYERVFSPASKAIRAFCLRHEPLRSALIRLKGYKTYKLSTLYDYCKEHDGIIKLYDDSCMYPARPLCKTREEFESNIFAEPVMRPSYYIYASKIEDAVIFGGEDFIVAGNCCLTDRKTQIQGDGYYISRNFPEIEPNHALVRMRGTPEVIEKGIDLVKMWSGNYYHFSVEALSRLQLVDAVEEYRTWPLIVDGSAMRNVWNVKLLEMVNVYNHPVIPVSNKKMYLVHELIYPSFLNWGEYKSEYSSSIHTMYADYYRERITSRHQPQRKYHNVYIARGDSKRLLNEAEVIECLKRYGFEIIYQGAGNYGQSIDAFMTADNIVGITGANMCLQMTSKPEANIYIILPFEYQHEAPGFAITDASRRKLHFIPADIHRLGPVLPLTDFTIDIAKIEALAQRLSLAVK